MTYVSRKESPYFVRIRYDKKAGLWQTSKYKGQQLISAAEGPEFERAMIQTTIRGPEPDEPCD